MLQLIDIKKDYKITAGVVPALKGVDLCFRKNEFVCILGQSGCGKTTLLNIIGGLDHYTSGDLIIQGKSTKNFKDKDWDVYRNHRIGFIFQSYNLIPHQTVLGNVELALTIGGVSKEERKKRAIEALERVGLGAELNKRPNQLSGGQMQRVSIARALVNNPDILLADEPTGALDSETSVQIMDLIQEIAGERLVIMVTHNPELADTYASRIVRLRDGMVESDSNPYPESEEREEEGQREIVEESPKQSRKEKKQKARMSFLTSLALSGRNLLTKKGRTLLTSFAGSIGIISVCLVLALSSGFNRYIAKTEEDMLSYYPVQITKDSIDIMSVMTGMSSIEDLPDLEQIGDKVYVNSFLTNIAQGMSVQNDISDQYLHYLDNLDPSLYHDIQYKYGTVLTDNLFTKVDMGQFNLVGQDNSYVSLSQLKATYAGVLTSAEDKYAQLVPMVEMLGEIVGVMPGTGGEDSETDFGRYILSQYDVVEGRFPQKGKNEVVLVVGEHNDVTDLTLAQLGMMSLEEFGNFFPETATGEAQDRIPFSRIVEQEYVLYYNDSVYKQLGVGGYEFTYQGMTSQEGFENVAQEAGMKIKVSGVLRLKEGMTYGCLKSGLYFTEQTSQAYQAKNFNSQIVEWIRQKGEEKIYTCPAANLQRYYVNTVGDNEKALRALGGVDMPNAINLYLRDFEGKERVLSYLDAWNDFCDRGVDYTYEKDGVSHTLTLAKGNQVKYTDTVGLLMGLMQTILDVITYVLVAFTAISLIVSSVMIGIITYVSVVERVKEIGVLRSLGARKRDIKNLFNAETFIIGLSAGLIGVLVTYLLEIPINAIIYSLSGISGIAALPLLTSGIMVIISVGLTLISGLIPASAAAKKDPVIALRTE